MNLNKFTEKAQEAVVAAPQLASELSHAQVEPEHLVVTLAEQLDDAIFVAASEIGLKLAGVGSADIGTGRTRSTPGAVADHEVH